MIITLTIVAVALVSAVVLGTYVNHVRARRTRAQYEAVHQHSVTVRAKRPAPIRAIELLEE